MECSLCKNGKTSPGKVTVTLNRDNSVILNEYAGTTLKYITVVVDNINRKPVEIISSQYSILKIAKDGRIDDSFRDERMRGAASIMSSKLPPLLKPKNVISLPSDFAVAKYKNNYTWVPTDELRTRVRNLIFNE